MMKSHRKHPQRQGDEHVIFERGAKHQRKGRLGSVKRLKARAAEETAIDDWPAHQHPEFRSRVDASAPNASAKGVEVFRMLAHQQGLRLTVPVLLLQICGDSRAAKMPHKGRRAETDFVACLLQAPAYVH